jgi:hypothetical protein
MSNLSKIITTFSVCEFLEETVKNPQNLKFNLQKFSQDCELLGGNLVQFQEMALRELNACRLLEQEGGGEAPSASDGPTNVTAGIAGLKPEDLAVPVSAQKRHTSRNSIFKRKKPNTYYNDKNNSY